MRNLDDCIHEIEEVLNRVEAPFVWRAAVEIEKPLALVFSDRARIPLSFASRTAREDALAELVKRANPAAFGIGADTRVDRRVRDGLALRNADDPFVVEGFDPNASGVVALAKEALVPDDTADLVAELYAVNVYRAGGRFATHKDTPRGEGMIGTLVLCLPWSFQGGALELSAEAGGRRVVLDWATEIARSSAFPCAAFFADVDHRVHEVTSGARVTLTWLLRRAKPKKTAMPRRGRKVSTPAAAELAALLASLAADETVAGEGLALRFACAHDYAVTPETPAVRPIVTEDDAHVLKGRDAIVARAAVAAGLRVSIAYFVWIVDEQGPPIELRIDGPPTPKKLARLRKVVARAALGEEGGFSGEDFDEELAASDDVESRVLGYHGASVTKLGEGTYSSTGYFGNEASAAAYYVGAALDVVVPRRALPDAARREVTHAKWGKGTIVAVSGEGDDTKYRVRFATGEEKTLLARFLA